MGVGFLFMRVTVSLAGSPGAVDAGHGHFVVVEVELLGVAAEAQRRPRVDRRVAAGRVDVVARASAVVPDGAAQRVLNFGVPDVLDVLLDLDASRADPLCGLDPADDVVGEQLDQRADRAVAVADVRAEHHEGVRVAVDRDRLVGVGAALPELGEHLAVATAHALGDVGVGDLEAGRVDDHVGLVVHAGAVDQAGRRDLGDAVRDDLRVVRGDRRVPRVAEEDALAAHREVRGELLAQLLVGHLLLQVAQGELLERRIPLRAALEQLQAFAAGVDRVGDSAVDRGEAAVASPSSAWSPCG